MGIFYGTLAGLVQGLAEALILSIRYSGHILTPQVTFKTQAFFLIEKLLGLDESASIPFILDRYLGYNFLDKIPLIYDLIVAYTILGLLAGLCLGIMLWTAFRLVKDPAGFDRLSMFYLSLIVSFGIFVNLIIWLNRGYLRATLSTSSLLVDSGLLVCAVFFTAIIYKLGFTLIGADKGEKGFSSRILVKGSNFALSSVGLLLCLALFLDIWLFREDKAASETIVTKSAPDGLIVPQDSKDEYINVVFISVDTLRADHLGCYGYNRNTSPNIDRLASEGVLFSNAFSVSSWTLPAHISMFTSMYSTSHGVITGEDYLDDSRITLAEVLKKEGYATAAFISGAYLRDPRYGFEQGFDLYDASIINDAAPLKDVMKASQVITSPSLNKAAKNWLEKNHRKKFFLFLHYIDVHSDYIPPPPYDTRFDPDYRGPIDGLNIQKLKLKPAMNPRDLFHVIALYDGEIAFTDHYIGEMSLVLKELGVYDNTMIILTSDHGEEFFEHGQLGHKRSLYDEVLRVPLIFKFPYNWKANRKSNKLVSIIDIKPTILDYLGIERHQEMQGYSLLPLVNGGKRSGKPLVYSRFEHELVAVRSARSKLIHHLQLPEKELYDLVNDPGEKINLLDKKTNEEIAKKEEGYLSSLLHWINIQHQLSESLPQTSNEKDFELSEEMKEELKSLGYMQ
jgi:arylsulfatase A-like enzyme